MKKSDVVSAILERLREDFEARQRASKTTREHGNDAESKAEGKYDTLAIEENYLADGLALKAHAAAQAISEIEKMTLRAFATDEEIDLGALVQVQFAKETEWFFLAPAGGGTEVAVDGVAVTVITRESPLGLKLLGEHVGGRMQSPTAVIVAVV